MKPAAYRLTNNEYFYSDSDEDNFHSKPEKIIETADAKRGFCVLPLFEKKIFQEHTYSYSLNSDTLKNIGVTTETPFAYVLWEIIACDFYNEFNPSAFTLTRVHFKTRSEEKTTTKVFIQPTDIFMDKFPFEENQACGVGFQVWFRFDSTLKPVVEKKETVAERRARLGQSSIFGSSVASKPVPGLAKFLEQYKPVSPPVSPPVSNKRKSPEPEQPIFPTERESELLQQLEQANKKIKQQEKVIQQQQETIKKYEESFLQMKHVLNNF